MATTFLLAEQRWTQAIHRQIPGTWREPPCRRPNCSSAQYYGVVGGLRELAKDLQSSAEPQGRQRGAFQAQDLVSPTEPRRSSHHRICLGPTDRSGGPGGTPTTQHHTADASEPSPPPPLSVFSGGPAGLERGGGGHHRHRTRPHVQLHAWSSDTANVQCIRHCVGVWGCTGSTPWDHDIQQGLGPSRHSFADSPRRLSFASALGKYECFAKVINSGDHHGQTQRRFTQIF